MRAAATGIPFADEHSQGGVMLAYLTFLVHLLEHEDAFRCEVVNYDQSGYVGGSVYEY